MPNDMIYPDPEQDFQRQAMLQTILPMMAKGRRRGAMQSPPPGDFSPEQKRRLAAYGKLNQQIGNIGSDIQDASLNRQEAMQPLVQQKLQQFQQQYPPTAAQMYGQRAGETNDQRVSLMEQANSGRGRIDRMNRMSADPAVLAQAIRSGNWRLANDPGMNRALGRGVPLPPQEQFQFPSEARRAQLAGRQELRNIMDVPGSYEGAAQRARTSQSTAANARLAEIKDTNGGRVPTPIERLRAGNDVRLTRQNNMISNRSLAKMSPQIVMAMIQARAAQAAAANRHQPPSPFDVERAKTLEQMRLNGVPNGTGKPEAADPNAPPGAIEPPSVVNMPNGRLTTTHDPNDILGNVGDFIDLFGPGGIGFGHGRGRRGVDEHNQATEKMITGPDGKPRWLFRNPQTNQWEDRAAMVEAQRQRKEKSKLIPGIPGFPSF